MSRDLVWEDRRVDHAERLHTVNAQLQVDSARCWILSHSHRGGLAAGYVSVSTSCTRQGEIADGMSGGLSPPTCVGLDFRVRNL